MKDTVIKGDGTSRILKAPASMPETFEEWRSQLLAGNATMDIGLNVVGCNVVGTAMSKANLLSDATKNALELTGNDPTVNDALYALSQSGSSAEVRVMGDVGTTVTMVKNNKTLTSMVGESRFAILYPKKLGEWSLTYTWNGAQITKPFVLEVIGIITIYPFTVGDSLETTSWANISEISKAGLASQFFNIGDMKNIKINNGTYPVLIIGFNHDNLTTGGKAGITFQLKKCASSGSMNTSATNNGGWTSSFMRTNKLINMLNDMEADLKPVIKSVNKLTSAGNQSANIITTPDKLFLLSEVEIFGKTSYSKVGEGSQYAFYAAGNSGVKDVYGDGCYWWERSPHGGNTRNFCCVSSNDIAGQDEADRVNYVSFGFCV